MLKIAVDNLPSLAEYLRRRGQRVATVVPAPLGLTRRTFSKAQGAG